MQSTGLSRAGLAAPALRWPTIRAIGAAEGLSLVPGASLILLFIEESGDLAYDMSGGGNHARFGSTPDADTNDPLRITRGVALAGDDFLDCGVMADLDAAVAAGAFTLTVAFTPTTMSDYNAVIGKFKYGAANEWGFGFRSSGRIDATRRDGSANSTLFTPAGTVVPNVPQVITWSCSDDRCALLKNGTLATSNAGGAIRPSTAALPFRIGATVTPGLFPIGEVHAVLAYPFGLADTQDAQNVRALAAVLKPKGVWW